MIRKNNFKISIMAILILFSANLYAENVSNSSLAIDTSQSELKAFIELFTADLGSLDRFYNIPIAKKRSIRLTEFYDEWLERIKKLPFDSLSPEGKVDFILFINYLNGQKHRLELQKKQTAEIESLVSFAEKIVSLEETRKNIEAIDPKKVADFLFRIKAEIKNLEKDLTAKPQIKRNQAWQAAKTVDFLRDVLRKWFEFYNGYDPLFTWWVEKPYQELNLALENYSAFLRKEIAKVKPGEILGDPVGRDILMKELSLEMIPYTPEELIEIAQKEMAWCERMMVQASQEMGLGDDWRKALEKVKDMHVEPGKQPQLVRDLAKEAIAFLEKNNLLTIPPLAKETWRMEMMTPEQQLINPFFTGGEVIRVSFPTNTMSHEAKMMSLRGNNLHFARATVHHELIPGHHLQGFMNSRYKTYRRIFRTPFWTEGWALYWEMLLWDLGFPQSPENKIGMLFWRMHRCARVIFSINFHLEKMTPEECVDFLMKKVGHERANAEGEVRRSFEGSYGSLYQLAYFIGALQFRALEKELVKSGKMSYRDFHDAILRENNIPVEILRSILKKEELKIDYKSKWKFY